MSVIVTKEPQEEPFDLVAAKIHLRETEDDQDALIESLITAAREYMETETGRAFVTTELQLQLTVFPGGEIRLPRPPLQEVTSITYIDPDGQEQTLDPAKYQTDKAGKPGLVAPAYAETWPDVKPGYGSVKINYKAGYGAAADVPKILISAMKALITHWYENREAVVTGTITSEVPLSVQRVIDLKRVYYV